MPDPIMRTYSPKDVSITFFGNIISGFADGDFLAISSEENFTPRQGADGTEDRINMNITGMTVELTLMQTAAINDVLAGIYETDRNTNVGKGVFQAVDGNGTGFIFSEQAYITKRADKTYGNSLGTITWSFRLPQAQYIPGFNL